MSVDASRLKAYGIVQEQHPDRTALFNQWQNLPMTLLADPLNRLGVSAVPIVLLVDEYHVIRYRNPQPRQLREFLRADYEGPPKSEGETAEGGTAWTATPRADRQAMRGRLDEAIRRYESRLADHSDEASTVFRLGVTYRMRFDRDGQTSDFARAVTQWRRALALDPNQYIWRRRIQQYGPILDKPYPFYRWIEQARSELRARGETPVALAVEPAGAELAAPGQAPAASTQPVEPPDSDGRLHRDTTAIQLDLLSVPSTDSDHRAVRLHIRLEPRADGPFVWNNEADPLTVWLDTTSDAVHVSRRKLTQENPPPSTSREPRWLEAEVRWDDDTTAPAISGYAVYHVCDKRNGTCTVRRQDFEFSLAVSNGGSSGSVD